MQLVDWNNPEHVAWLCEQAGVEFRGLPLAHGDRLRLISITSRHPSIPNNIPKLTKPREVPMTIAERAAQPAKIDAPTAEKQLLEQYEAEVKRAQDRQVRYKQLLSEAKADEKSYLKKFANLSKLLKDV